MKIRSYYDYRKERCIIAYQSVQKKLFLKSPKRGIFVKQNAVFTEFIL